MSILESVRDRALNLWVAGEREVVSKDREKFAVADTKLKGVPLWDAALTRAERLIQQHDAPPNLLRLRSAFMSVQSSTGNSLERLFLTLGKEMISAGTAGSQRHLVGICSDDDFVRTIQSLRVSARGSGASVDVVETVARQYFVTEQYVSDLVSNPKRSTHYPDTVSVFDTGESDRLVVLAEHKLSGDNDSKAVSKNLETLEGARANFVVDGQAVKTVLALPFTSTDGRMAARWEHHSAAADVTAVNRDVWEHVLGVQISEEEYGTYLDRLAELAAQRIFQYVAPADLVLSLSENGQWTWTRTEAVASGGTVEATSAAQETLRLFGDPEELS